MKKLLFAVLLSISLAGCSKSDGRSAYAPKQAMRGVVAAEVSGKVEQARSYLAYEHHITVDVPMEQMAAVHATAQAACRDATEDRCTVLDSRVTTGKYPSASVKVRVKAAGVQKLIVAMGKQGDITSQSTSAEDLEGPIVDAEKKLAMLKEYRGKLEALQARANNDVDALIKLTRELSQTQSDLEAMAGSHARLMQRVDYEILTINIEAEQNQSFLQPIRDAVASFFNNLSQGIASAITGLAYLIPWLLILVGGIWGGRWLWRRRKAAKGGQ